MASGGYLGVRSTDVGDVHVNRCTAEDSLAQRTVTPIHSRTSSPSPRAARKKMSGHKGQAGFGSSVINLANTILGTGLTTISFELGC